MSQPVLLSMEHIIKRFADNVVVNDVSINIHAGRILALLGENGAGKSTLIKVLAGVYRGDGGRIVFEGNEIASAQAIRSRTSQPIAFIHQDLGLVDWMTVAENMAFTMGYPRRFGLIDHAAMNRRAAQALQAVGIDLDPQTRVFNLSRTEKSLLAIARAISVDARVLILDEPTASLPANDVEHLFTVLNRLRDKGVGMLYITHRLDEVIAISDDICVMRDGCHVASGATAQYAIKDLVRLIVGKEKPVSRPNTPTNLQPLLILDQLFIGETGPVSFTLHKGEMLALAGLRGAGQEEVGRALFGLADIASGKIVYQGQAIQPQDPRAAIKTGISMVAGDRLGESLAPALSVAENMFLNPCSLGHRPLAWLRGQKEMQTVREQIALFDVRPASPEAMISALSGGNQQKVILARWMSLGTPLLILEDPTAGVDVGARAEIYDLLRSAMQRGIAVLVISTDFEEIAAICNRALVFNRGRVVGELRDDAVSFSGLLQLAAGTASDIAPANSMTLPNPPQSLHRAQA